MLVDCWGWLVNQDDALYQNSLQNGSVSRGTWMWAAIARTWRRGSPHGSRLCYLPLLISYGLLWLNPRAWGDAATIPTTSKRSYHHLAILKHQYYNNEYNVDNNNYNNNFKKCSFWYTYTRKIYFFFSLQQKWHSPTLRSGIHQHLSTNSLWLSPTTLTSRLRIYGYCGYPTAR